MYEYRDGNKDFIFLFDARPVLRARFQLHSSLGALSFECCILLRSLPTRGAKEAAISGHHVEGTLPYLFPFDNGDAVPGPVNSADDAPPPPNLRVHSIAMVKIASTVKLIFLSLISK